MSKQRLDLLLRRLRWHRRGLSALFAALAVLCLGSALSPDAPRTTPVLVAGHDLAAGHAVVAADLVTADFPPGLVPAGALAPEQSDELLGRRLSVPAPRGTPLGAQSVVGSRAVPKGERLVPVRLSDPSLLANIRVGDQVDLVGAGGDGRPVPLATAARVADVPRGEAGQQDALLLVATDPTTATRLAAWSSTQGVGVVLG